MDVFDGRSGRMQIAGVEIDSMTDNLSSLITEASYFGATEYHPAGRSRSYRKSLLASKHN